MPTIVTRDDRICADGGRPVGASGGAASGVSARTGHNGRASLTERERGPQRELAQLAVTVARTAETRVSAPLFVAVAQDDRRSASVPTPATWERHARRAAVPAVVGLRSAFALW